MKTDKELLVKGLKYMVIAALLMFAGPTLLYTVIGDQEKSTYIPLLIIGLLICVGAIIFSFKGLQVIMDSIFKKKN